MKQSSDMVIVNDRNWIILEKSDFCVLCPVGEGRSDLEIYISGGKNVQSNKVPESSFAKAILKVANEEIFSFCWKSRMMMKKN